MDIKIATLADQDTVFQMCLKFANTTYFKEHIDENKIRQLVKEFITFPSRIVLMCADKGMLAGMVYPFLYGHKLIATEVVWWVEPEYRGEGVGQYLLQAFEQWAKESNCALISVECLDDEIGKYYESKRFTLYERAYMKEI